MPYQPSVRIVVLRNMSVLAAVTSAVYASIVLFVYLRFGVFSGIFAFLATVHGSGALYARRKACVFECQERKEQGTCLA